jgi:methionine synthase II (cobalamin-independent)
VFATLLGGLPHPPLPDGVATEALVEAAIRAQEAAGLDPISDGGQFGEWQPLDAWRATAALTDRSVKQAVQGPYSAGLATGPTTVLAHAESLNAVLHELSAAGCPFIEVHEPAATEIGADPAARELFREAHRRLLDGVIGTHLSLAITGGNADTAGIDTLLAAPYASLAVDLIAGPDNWRLVVATPGDRGIICGALSAVDGADDGPELLLWAAGYAASTGGRGSARVGLATASSLANLSWAAAVRKLERLGEAARLAALPLHERVQHMDPRSVSSRSAALGRVDPSPSRGSDQGSDAT